MKNMKIGISVIPTERSIDPAVLAKRAEELGFESLWVPDQPVLPVTTTRDVPRLWGDIVSPLIMLARASAVTSKIKLGTAVVVVTEHDIISLAKEMATLDVYSGGRFLFGIGTGSVEEEASIMGCDFPRRWTQAREAVMAMKELWTKEQSEFHGDYYDFPPVYCSPKPARKPHPPVLLGSMTSNAFKRIVAYGDGWIPIGVTPEQVKEGRIELDRLARSAGRGPASIEISIVDVPADRQEIGRYEEAGADRAIVSLPTEDGRENLEELERIADAVLG